MLNNRITFAAGALLAAAGFLVTAACAAPPADLPACEQEDSVSCYWDAHTRGNGQGRSFWVNEHGAVHYVNE